MKIVKQDGLLNTFIDTMERHRHPSKKAETPDATLQKLQKYIVNECP